MQHERTSWSVASKEHRGPRYSGNHAGLEAFEFFAQSIGVFETSGFHFAQIGTSLQFVQEFLAVPNARMSPMGHAQQPGCARSP